MNKKTKKEIQIAIADSINYSDNKIILNAVIITE